MGDIDTWASIIGVGLVALAICAKYSDPRNHTHTKLLVASAPAIFVMMVIYGIARYDNAWCFVWAVGGIFVSTPLAAVALARLTAHYVSDASKSDMGK
ncbi:hypothetical protein DDZ13_05295 [Coraliomargarita sinensis]|uniref:Uncharacterized protein n=1 Tax=Coraliomargarita sinensis TaxID=2174842 RepID=A0A317ZMG8_9BACT|nr:hypothetical protein [Coraliomargarita sinensis]PXA04591.1 hypothetical protein DDZ13_05295 [Coraliomargarita sinensis]